MTALAAPEGVLRSGPSYWWHSYRMMLRWEMASLRMVADLGDADKVLAVLPGGVTGRLFHPHATDQIQPFLDGEPRHWWFSDQAIQAHARTTLVLNPGPAPEGR